MNKVSARALKVAFFTTDNRYFRRDYVKVPYFGTAPEALLKGFPYISGLEVHVISCTRHPLEAPEKLAENIWYHSLLVPKIGWMTTAYQGTIRAVRKALRGIRPDIAHGQGSEADNGMNAAFSGYPSVLTLHGVLRRITKVDKEKPFSYNWLAARLESLTLRKVRGVVCLSRHAQEEVAPVAKKTWVVPNAVDPSFFEINNTSRELEEPHLYCNGVIRPLKNQNALIRSLDALAQKRKFKLVFLGQMVPGQPYDEEFRALVRERPWCVYGGHASRDQLKECLLTASGVLMPSLEENCPMAILEGMAAGVPVIGARVGGVPDLIEEDRTGWFCDPLSPASMAAAVEKLLSDRAAAAKIAAAARSRALERFHPKVIAQRHLEIYREVLGRSG